MHPKASTNFPPDYIKEIKTVFQKAFVKKLQKRTLFVEGRIQKERAILSVGFKPEPKALKQINFEASISHKTNDLFKMVGICVDAISSMMDHYFEQDSSNGLPTIWTEFEFDGQKLLLQVSGVNTELENKANRILGLPRTDALVDIPEEENVEEEEETEDDKAN